MIEALLVDLEKFLCLTLSRDKAPSITTESANPGFCAVVHGDLIPGSPLNLRIQVTLGMQTIEDENGENRLDVGAYVFFFQESTRLKAPAQGDYLWLRYILSGDLQHGHWQRNGWLRDEWGEFEEVTPSESPKG